VLNLNSPRFINKRFVISSEAAEAQSDRTQDFFDSKLVLHEPKPQPKKRKPEYLSELLQRASANPQPKPPPPTKPLRTFSQNRHQKTTQVAKVIKRAKQQFFSLYWRSFSGVRTSSPSDQLASYMS